MPDEGVEQLREEQEHLRVLIANELPQRLEAVTKIVQEFGA
jgi:hypothetical protein